MYKAPDSCLYVQPVRTNGVQTMVEDKGARFNMRVDPQELGRWKSKAKESGLSVSDWLRFLANEDAENPSSVILTIPVPDGTLERWKASAQIERLSVSDWARKRCNENPYLPPSCKKDLVEPAVAVKRIGRAPSAKKVKRAAAAKAARASVNLPQRTGSKMVDVHMDLAQATKECVHHKTLAQGCGKCDPKYGVPNIPE